MREFIRGLVFSHREKRTRAPLLKKLTLRAIFSTKVRVQGGEYPSIDLPVKTTNKKV